MQENKNALEDYKVNTKIKLAGLWTSLMFCFIYGDYFELYVPHKVEGLLNGQNMMDNPMKLFAATIMMTIPILMIFLSLLLQPRLNRILNIIFGFFFTALMILIAFNSLTTWMSFYVFLAIIESFISFIIIKQAWTWKKINE
ncbi:MAG: DUF6326 family protein [Chitinophagaceae bacterium]